MILQNKIGGLEKAKSIALEKNPFSIQSEHMKKY